MYRMKVVFRVQREIVSGLLYYQDAYRKGIRGTELVRDHVSHLATMYVEFDLTLKELVHNK